MSDMAANQEAIEMARIEHRSHKAVKAARDYLGLTQAELAARLNLFHNRKWNAEKVTALEAGRRKIDDDVIRALVKATNFAPGWFLYGPGDLLWDAERVKGLKTNRDQAILNHPVPLAAA